MINLNPFKNPIGLDISDYKIRFFQFDSKRKDNVKIQSFGEIEVPPGIIVSGELKNESKVIALLKQLLEEPLYGKIKNKYVNASLPEKKIYIKTIQIPNVPDNEVNGAVKWGIEQNIPVTLDQVYYDWQIISRNQKNENEKIKVLASVAPQAMIDLYTNIIKKVDLIPISFENESVALSRCLIDQKSNIRRPLLILDIGRSRTNLIIYNENVVQFTSTIDINGEEMTEVISKNLKLSFKDAEKAKIICGLDQRKGRGAIKKILEPIMSRLIIRIRENLDYYNDYVTPEKSINTILLTGSASKMGGLTKFLQQNLKTTAIIGDPWTNITPNKDKGKKSIWKNDFFSFTTAIGLALKPSD